MLSEMTVVGMPSFINSHAVRREPCRKGRVRRHRRDFLTLLDGCADHAERGAVTGRGERSGIAVREHAAARWHQRCTVSSHRLIRGDIFGVHALGFFDQALLNLDDGTGAGAEGFKFLLHATDRPKINSLPSTRLTNRFADRIEIFFEIFAILRFRIFRAQRDAHCGGDTNGGRSAHNHVADYVSYLLVCGAGYVNFFGGQLRLIDKDDALRSPFESFNHKFLQDYLSGYRIIGTCGAVSSGRIPRMRGSSATSIPSL